MLIVGPGAIGSLVCAQFQEHYNCYAYAHRPDLELAEQLINHSDSPAEAKQQSLQPSLTTPSLTALKWQAHTSMPNLSIDIIWVCCKAFHSHRMTQQLLQQHPNAIAILLHNGMGPQQTLSDEFAERVLWGATTCGAIKQSSNVFCQTALGQTQIGYPTPQPLPTLVKQLIDDCSQTTPFLGLTANPNIQQVLWHKLLANSVINPITAYAQCNNGDVLAPEFTADVAGICQEVTHLMRQQDIEPPADAVAFVRSLAQLTASNRSSMAEDVRQARKTEIDFILGFLLEQAKQTGFATPFISRWYQRIIQHNQTDA